MVDVRGDVLRPPHGTTPAAVKSNKNQKWDPLRAMKTNIHKKKGGWYYVVSANKASSVTLCSETCIALRESYTSTGPAELLADVVIQWLLFTWTIWTYGVSSGAHLVARVNVSWNPWFVGNLFFKSCWAANICLSVNSLPSPTIFQTCRLNSLPLTLEPTQGFFMRKAKTLSRLGGCQGWSEFPLGTYVILLVLSCCGSIFFYLFNSRNS